MASMPQATSISMQPEPQVRDFYLDALAVLDRSEVPYLVGGGYAVAFYTGIARQTKDLDLFIRQRDSQRALDMLAAAGYRTEWTWPHFLGKAMNDHAFVDILYNSGNGLCAVDDQWFEHGVDGHVLGRRVLLCPAEEILWTKIFVQERDRFDGADVAHLILSCGRNFVWRRLLDRVRSHERVLLAHLVLFGYIYPSERDCVPAWVVGELVDRIRSEPSTSERICRGMVLALNQFTFDVEQGGFRDARPQLEKAAAEPLVATEPTAA